MMEYIGDGLYMKPCADGSIDLIEDRPAGRVMIKLDKARTNAIVGAMRRHWAVKPMCVLCGALHKEAGGAG